MTLSKNLVWRNYGLNSLEDVWMTELVHKLNLLEHVIAVGPVLVQFQDHHFVTCLVSDLKIKVRIWINRKLFQIEFIQYEIMFDSSKKYKLQMNWFYHVHFTFCVYYFVTRLMSDLKIIIKLWLWSQVFPSMYVHTKIKLYMNSSGIRIFCLNHRF